MLYSDEQRLRRDRSPWTVVQGVLAPLQFAVFVASFGLVLHFLLSGSGYAAATASIVAKTALLYAIMITGAIWEKDVFGQYLFAKPFFWEDVVSIVVLALHTAYLAALWSASIPAGVEMSIALAAYAAYMVNAAQFVWKLILAKRTAPSDAAAGALS